jgi:hypothetical protein
LVSFGIFWYLLVSFGIFFNEIRTKSCGKKKKTKKDNSTLGMLVLLVLVLIVVCFGNTESISIYGGGTVSLLPPAQHQKNCYGFPDQTFSKQSFVSICDPGSGCKDKGLGVQTGKSKAPDFQLSSTNGKIVNLYSLLKEKPVFIQFGSFT